MFLMGRERTSETKPVQNLARLRIFVKPKRVKRYVVLRAPYRYKVARLHYMYNRYFMLISLQLAHNGNYANRDLGDWSRLNKMLVSMPDWFDSALCRQHKTRFHYDAWCPNMFTLSLYECV